MLFFFTQNLVLDWITYFVLLLLSLNLSLLYAWLQRCVECDGNFSTCATPPGSVDGSGIPNADLVIYVGTSLANGICSPTSSVIAFASACQLENTLDRYS